MNLTILFKDFFRSERAGGLVLILCSVLSIIISNLFPTYSAVWEIQVASHSIRHWINDGLMAIFFLLIGLELERELYIGELSEIKTAMLPLIAAVGGMLFPAVVYLTVNWNSDNIEGFGVPMATDIAFALGALSLLGNRVSYTLRILLTALAVVDDLGAILIIAIFYTDEIKWIDLMVALSIFGILITLNRLKIHRLLPYLILAFPLWLFIYRSGVHASVAGVLVAFAIPFGTGDANSSSHRLQQFLHNPVAFLIIPLFALANTVIPLEGIGLNNMVSIGIMAGLLLGKPLGIFLLSFLSVKAKICSLPAEVNWAQIFGLGLLGGVGFTMSIFIALLAFDDIELINNSKVAVIIASVASGVAGMLWLRLSSTPTTPAEGP
jgi:NhaA family Na+:H+ antiporter